MDIHGMLRPERVIMNLKATTKREALVEMVEDLGKAPGVTDVEALKKAILDREEIMSTGVGLTIAVPHAKLASVKAFTLGLARSARGIDYDSLDGQPVRIIVAIAAPDNDQNTYLRVLAAVMSVLRVEDKRKAILAANTPAEVVNVFKE
ncbi:MAG: PTS sugar transporter subunit IIA [Planctomycetes bacterium]|jgi:fructose-specific phosphotransferase system IIA component|nr:PTS sugar transporter subunit IIA [Planctomycetota bacterium]MCL4731733.1 PTS sugar transporter subunit IIA [Planctomycetota bacterium]